ncbi:MAG: arginine--tRNA ligase [Syntrophomonadaceae bacterium]|nr:arginine--tRNA ligase [Syntrophomonadaceae bacterium]
MNPVQEIKVYLKKVITDSLHQAVEKGKINCINIPDFIIEVPREKEHGDFACNVAMMLAREARMSPKKIADILTESIVVGQDKTIARLEVAGPGFINIFLNNQWLYEIPYIVQKLGSQYGSSPPQNRKVQVEFVSANPTGNLHMGNARGGAIGDTLANILQKAGYTVEREYYINDAGNQIELYGESLDARYLQRQGIKVDIPEQGYAGQDVIDTVNSIISKYGEILAKSTPDERKSLITAYALKEKLEYIKETLERFGIKYDNWFSEKTLHPTGKIEDVISCLKGYGYVYENEGAWWFKSTLFGDEKDEVVIRANGLPTYFAADIAYHRDKFERGFDQVINIWGADHHGHIARMKGAIKALGYDPDKLDVVLMQLVRLYRKGELVRMSKRTGTTVSLDELIDEVGKDAARFFFVLRSPDSHLDFDLELAKEKSQDNPVYYVQYAHARICSIFRQAGLAEIDNDRLLAINTSLLIEEEELALMRKIADFPEEIRLGAISMAPHRIARYVLDLAALFHTYYNRHRVLNEDADLQNARLLLMSATRITIKNALDIIGVNAPEHM